MNNETDSICFQFTESVDMGVWVIGYSHNYVSNESLSSNHLGMVQRSDRYI